MSQKGRCGVLIRALRLLRVLFYSNVSCLACRVWLTCTHHPSLFVPVSHSSSFFRLQMYYTRVCFVSCLVGLVIGPVVSDICMQIQSMCMRLITCIHLGSFWFGIQRCLESRLSGVLSFTIVALCGRCFPLSWPSCLHGCRALRPWLPPLPVSAVSLLPRRCAV